MQSAHMPVRGDDWSENTPTVFGRRPKKTDERDGAHGDLHVRAAERDRLPCEAVEDRRHHETRVLALERRRVRELLAEVVDDDEEDVAVGRAAHGGGAARRPRRAAAVQERPQGGVKCAALKTGARAARAAHHTQRCQTRLPRTRRRPCSRSPRRAKISGSARSTTRSRPTTPPPPPAAGRRTSLELMRELQRQRQRSKGVTLEPRGDQDLEAAAAAGEAEADHSLDSTFTSQTDGGGRGRPEHAAVH